MKEIASDVLSTITGGDQAMVNGLSPKAVAFSCVKVSEGKDNMLGSKSQFLCFDSTGKPAGAGTFDDGALARVR
jgi:hypothetical protein